MPKEITYELSDKTLAKLRDIAGGGGSLTDICYVLDADSETLGEDIEAYFESMQTDPRPVVVKRNYNEAELYYETTPYQIQPTRKIPVEGVMFNCKYFYIFFIDSNNYHVDEGNCTVIQQDSNNMHLTLETLSGSDGQTLYVSTEEEVTEKSTNYIIRTENGFNADNSQASLATYEEKTTTEGDIQTSSDSLLEVRPEGVNINLFSEDNTQEEPITKNSNYEFTHEGLYFNKKLIGSDALVVKLGENYNVQVEGDLPEDIITNEDIFNALIEGKEVKIIYTSGDPDRFGWCTYITNYVDTVVRHKQAGEDEDWITYHFTLVVPYKEDGIGITWDDENQVLIHYDNSPNYDDLPK